MIRRVAYGLLGALLALAALTVRVNAQGVTIVPLPRTFGASTFSGTITPATSDGAALGTTALMWSDLFLASGAVINFNNGDVTLTHGSNLLTLSGGSLDVGTSLLLFGGSTNSFPSLKRSTTVLYSRLADDSADAPFGALALYISGNGYILRSTSAMSDGAGASSGTMTNAPVAGNPTKWLKFDDNGTDRFIPAW